MKSEKRTPKGTTGQTKAGKAGPRESDELSKEALDKATGGLVPAVGPQK